MLFNFEVVSGLILIQRRPPTFGFTLVYVVPLMSVLPCTLTSTPVLVMFIVGPEHKFLELVCVLDITDGRSSLCMYFTVEMLMFIHCDSIPVPFSVTCVGTVFAAAYSGAMHLTLFCESFGLSWQGCFLISCTSFIFRLFNWRGAYWGFCYVWG